MSEGKYTAAQRIVDERRQRAIALAAAHTAEAEQKIPQIKYYHIAKRRHFAAASAEILRADLTGEEKRARLLQLKQESEVMNQSIKDLLLRGGFPADYLEEKFTCPLCCDMGNVDGKRCSCLEELAKKQAARSFAEQIPVKLTDFADFRLEYYSPVNVTPGKHRNDREQMAFIYDSCVEYAERFDPKTSRSLFFTGATGLGKTFLSLAIAKKVLELGIEVIYTSALDLFRNLQDDYYNAGREKAVSMDDALDIPLLIIDDLGSEYLNQFVPSALFHIVESRLEHGLPTIISTNLSGAEMEKRYAKRVYSRIFTQYLVFSFVGSDIRVLKLKNGLKLEGEMEDGRRPLY